MNWSKTGDAAALALIVGYIAAVLYQGNPDKLARELAKEGGFVEFLIAIFVLWTLVESKAVGKIAAPIVGVAVFAAAMVFLSRSGTIDALKAWQNGQASMLDTVLRMFGANKTEVTQ